MTPTQRTAALGFVTAPTRPIEVLIAVSILVSAIHALRAIFPGREAVIAAFFGLIHGLAFAATLTSLGFDRWHRILGILAFNLGIEAMQLLVVALTIPSLVLLSRTPVYSYVRIGGALFAASASIAWIAERLLNIQTPVDAVLTTLARHALWTAGGLAVFSFASFAWTSAAAEIAPLDRSQSTHPPMSAPGC